MEYGAYGFQRATVWNALCDTVFSRRRLFGTSPVPGRPVAMAVGLERGAGALIQQLSANVALFRYNEAPRAGVGQFVGGEFHEPPPSSPYDSAYFKGRQIFGGVATK